MDSPKLGDKVQRVQQQGKRTNKQQHTTPENETAEEESSPAQILERVKPDRVTASKPEEDRRRRTIIVEKKNGSFGFTLQSYGIHYKKEQEIEMITYVDYVDYDGAAFRAGMREGDVILSINGHDMEKADHKALVNFIKNCETRMRMVVLFEDCVRKVELHMRYIQLQRVLQSKMSELERLCLRERDLLQGKWKTHSLPARKKAASAVAADGSTEITQDDDVATDYASCRPTVSTEDVARAHQHPPTQQLLLAYQYLDPRYRAYFIQPTQGPNGEYLWPTQCGVIEASRAHAARHGSAKGYHQTNGMAAAGPGVSSSKPSSKPPPAPTSHHLCNPCVAAGNGDSSSLDAYDLASPCCNPHCVPSARRRSRQHKKNGKAHEAHEDEEEATIVWKEVKPGRSSQLPSSSSHPPAPPHRGGPRYLAFGGGGGGGGLTSQCSLHSCTSSEMSGHVAHGSAASYTTSLSNDTLYWDDPPPHNGHGAGANGKHGAYAASHHHPHHQHHQYVVGPQFSPYNPEKPAKSWDNLTTKAFGGYGFGYGYLDTTSTKSAAAAAATAAAAAKTNHNRAHSTKANANGTHTNRNGTDRRLPSNQAGPSYQSSHNHQHIRYVQPTKSTESLLLLPKYKDATLSDSSLSCDCLDVTSPVGIDSARQPRFFPVSNPNVSAMGEQNFGNAYHLQQGRNQGSQTEAKRNSIQEGGPEITRL